MAERERLGRYTLLQTEEVFRLGGDTLALAAFATVRPRWRVCDLGCGSGALGLLLLEREPTLALTGVELDGAAAELCRRNFAENGLEHAQVLEGDLRRRSLLPQACFELVVSNPPWFDLSRGTSGGSARSEETCTLEELCTAGGRLVKNGGRLALVHRPERLTEVFAGLLQSGLEPKRMQMVHHGPSARPSAVLVEAVKNGRPGGLTVLPPYFPGVSQAQPGL